LLSLKPFYAFFRVCFFGGARFLYTRGASLRELERLSRSEHPLLRAVACLAMLRRKDADHLAVINGHLDDTALIRPIGASGV